MGENILTPTFEKIEPKPFYRQLQKISIRHTWLAIVLLLIYDPAWGATYYVDATGGSDTNAGITSTSPWKTIYKVSASFFSPGDSILLKRGETWRETLKVTSSGSSTSPITFGAYGSGNIPVINGANLITVWENNSGTDNNTWKSTVTTEPKQLFFNGIKGIKVASTISVNSYNKWYWESNTLYIYSSTNPSTFYKNPGIEASNRSWNIEINAKDHITFTNISARLSNSNGFQVSNSSHIKFINIEGSYNFDNGFSIWSTDVNYNSNVYISGGIFSYNGNNGLYLGDYLYKVVIDNCIFDHNGQNPSDLYNGGIYAAASNNMHGLIIQNCIAYSNGKDAKNAIVANPTGGYGFWMDTLGSDSGNDSNIIRYNVSYNNSNGGIQIENTNYAQAYYNISYNNKFGIEISCSDNKYPGENNRIYNNIFYGNDIGIYVHGKYKETGINNINNNLFSNNISTNNTYHNLRAIEGGQNVSDANGRGKGNAYTYNLFGDEKNKFIEWGTESYYSSYTSWESATGNCGFDGCSHSVKSDPHFLNPAENDFHLESNSPAIDAGTNVSLIRDYAGNAVPYGGVPDIGVYEFTKIPRQPSPPRGLRIN